MQFIFGSDKDHGYGFLYTEGKRSEVEQVKSAINFTIEAGVDAYGMVTFGANSNRPLFFRVKKDESYQREAYYIHGIYQDASPDYFTNGYKTDLFVDFIDQAKLDAIRMGQSPDMVPSINQNLAASASNVALDRGLLKEILVRLYQNEKVLLAVPDNYFSNDYARCLVSYLYSYLPPSLRKASGYISGVANIGNMRGIAIRIVSESMLANTNEPRYNVTAQGHVCSINSEFCGVIDEILALSATDRDARFACYEVLFNGFGSTYQPKKYMDFFKSAHGDVAAVEKIIDTYLANIADPSVDMVPDYAVEALKSKYNIGTQAAAFLEVSTVEELSDPSAVLQKNVSVAKKIYLFNDTPDAVFASAFDRVLNTIELNDEQLHTLCNALPPFVKSVKDDSKKYQFCFETAVSDYYRSQMTTSTSKISVCAAQRNAAFNVIKNDLAPRLPARVLTAEEIGLLKNEMESRCRAFYDEAAKYKYDLATAHRAAVEAAFAAHNEANKPVTGIASIGVEQIKQLDDLSRALMDKTSYADAMMAETVNIYSDCPNIVNLYAAQYALKKKTTIKSGQDAVFAELATTPGRIKEIAAITFESDPITALYLVATYAPVSEMMLASLALVRNNYALFNNVDPRRARSAINTVASILHKRLNENEVAQDVSDSIRRGLERFPEKQPNETAAFKMAGNIKLFYEAMLAAWAAFCKGKPFKPKKKKNAGLIWLITLLVLLVLAGATVLTLFLTGVLGGDDKDDSSDSEESGEVSGEVSDSGSESDASGDDSSAGDVSEGGDTSSGDETSTDDPDNTENPGNTTVTEAKSIVTTDYTASEGSGVYMVANVGDVNADTKWDLILYLSADVENGTIYNISGIKTNSVLDDTYFADPNHSYAIVFKADGDANVESAMKYAAKLREGDKLKENGNTYTKATAIDLTPENAILIDYFNDPCGDNQAIIRSGKNITAFLADDNAARRVGYRVLLQKSGDNYVVVEVAEEGSELTTSITNTTDILIIQIHLKNNNFTDAKKRMDDAKSMLVADAKVQISGYDPINECRVPDKSAKIYVSVVE